MTGSSRVEERLGETADGAAVTETGAGREVLRSTRGLLDPFLRAAVDRTPPSVHRVAGYHLGWLDENGCEVIADSGKAIRPALALVALGDLGLARPEPAAAAELRAIADLIAGQHRR